jgi:hypothetical protein
MTMATPNAPSVPTKSQDHILPAPTFRSTPRNPGSDTNTASPVKRIPTLNTYGYEALADPSSLAYCRPRLYPGYTSEGAVR